MLIVKKKSIASSGFGDVRYCQNISTECFQQECDAFYIILEMPFVQISNKQVLPIIILYETNRQNVIVFSKMKFTIFKTTACPCLKFITL